MYSGRCSLRIFARQKFGADFAPGGMAFIPTGAGHVIMAYALSQGDGTRRRPRGLHGGSGGPSRLCHQRSSRESFTNHTLTVTSSRYPFCATGALDQDNSIRAGMAPYRSTPISTVSA